MTKLFLRLTVILLLTTQICRGQYFAETASPVEGVGKVSLKKSANRLRAIVPITARGQNIREAAKALEERVQAAKLQLVTLKADGDSIRIGPISIDSSTSGTHREMLRHLRDALSDDVEIVSDAADGIKEMVMVRRHVTADWILNGDGVELLAASEEIRQNILDTEFNDATDQQQDLTPEEQELMEEAQMFGNSTDEEPNKPAIFFLATMTEEERAVMAKDAFAKARKSAQRLATASGQKLGKLMQVRESPGTASTENWNSYEVQQQYGSAQYAMMQADESDEDSELSTQDIEPNEMTFYYSLVVGYELVNE